MECVLVMSHHYAPVGYALRSIDRERHTLTTPTLREVALIEADIHINLRVEQQTLIARWYNEHHKSSVSDGWRVAHPANRLLE